MPPTIRVARERAVDAACDVLALPFFKGRTPGAGAQEVERALGVSVADLADQGGATGELGDVVVVPSLGKLPAGRVLLVGLGERGKTGTDEIRKAAALIARQAGKAAVVATTLPQAVRAGADAGCAAFAEGLLLGAYRFDRYKNENGERREIGAVSVLAGDRWDTRAAQRALDRGRVLAEATNLARDLTNTPAGDKSPISLAEEAERIASEGNLQIEILTERELREGGFGGILGVGQGSPKPPRLIAMRYGPERAKQTVAIVGKGITFDSGGINLKTQQLDWMKMDMGGAAAVLGTMQAISKLKPKVSVLGIVCSAENMPGGSAFHPGDVLRMRSGKTVEVGDTDAEGRLVMADGIAYAVEKGANLIADIATLTGASVIALGRSTFAVMGEPRSEVKRVLDAAGRAGEPAWELPLYAPYRKWMDSDIAEIKNISRRDAGGGAITAGLFLKEFTAGTPYVHLDIAGPAKSDAEEFEIPKGATGAGVRTLVEWLLAM